MAFSYLNILNSEKLILLESQESGIRRRERLRELAENISVENNFLCKKNKIRKSFGTFFFNASFDQESKTPDVNQLGYCRNWSSLQ